MKYKKEWGLGMMALPVWILSLAYYTGDIVQPIFGSWLHWFNVISVSLVVPFYLLLILSTDEGGGKCVQ